MAQIEILNQRENQILLNAALRNNQEDQENQQNNNNPEIHDRLAINSCQLKKYKCKSLDVSLDDINCNNNITSTIYNQLETTVDCEWPGANLDAVGGGKEYSTTLPRLTSKGQFGTNELSDSEDDEEYHEDHVVTGKSLK